MCLPTRPAALSACLLLVSVPAGATAQDQGDSDTPDDVTYGIDNAQSDEGLKVVEGGTKEKDSTDGSDDSAGRSGDEASNPEASGSSKSTSTDLNIEHHEKTPESLEAGATGEVSAEENSSADSGGDGPRSRIRRLVEEHPKVARAGEVDPETLAGQVDTSALRKLAETQIRTGGKYDVSKEAKPLSGAQREANLEWAYRLARQLRSTGDGQSIDGDLIGRALGRLADTPGSVTKLLEKHHSLGSSLSAEGYKSLLTTLRARGVQADVESLVAQCRKVTGSKTACEQLEKVENSDAGKSKEVTSEDVDRANKKLEGMDF